MKNGKGDKQRPGDLKKYQKNFEKVFGKKINKQDIKKLENIIAIETEASEQRQKRKIKIIKEYTDHNGVDMVIVNINDAMTNKVIDRRILHTLEHDIVSDSNFADSDPLPIDSSETQ